MVPRHILVRRVDFDQPWVCSGTTAGTDFAVGWSGDFRTISHSDANTAAIKFVARPVTNATSEYVAESTQRESGGASAACRRSILHTSSFGKYVSRQSTSIFPEYDR